MQLMQMKQELERQRQNSWDRVANTEDIQFEAREDGVRLNVNGPDGLPVRLQLTDWAHRQVSQKLKVPWRYYQRMVEHGEYNLLAHNCNTWLTQRDKRLVRVLDGQVRAFLSERYKYLENLSVMYAALETIKELADSGSAIEIMNCDVSQTNMYIKAMKPYTKEEIRVSDEVVPGIIISNSEVGAGRLSVSPVMVRLICRNGMISQQSFGRIHLGSARDEGLVDWSQRTKEIESDLIRSQVDDAIRAAFDPDIFTEWVDNVRKGATYELPNRVDPVEAIATEFRYSESEKKQLIDRFADNDKTQWGLGNAVTRYARDLDDPDRQVELEKHGAVIAEMDQDELDALIEEVQDEVTE